MIFMTAMVFIIYYKFCTKKCCILFFPYETEYNKYYLFIHIIHNCNRQFKFLLLLDMSTLIQQISRANIYLQPIQFVLSISLNIITIYILRSRALRTSPCAHYLLVYAIFAIIYMVQICPKQLLSAYNINIADNQISCKITGFTLNLPATLTRLMLLLASFDRFCSSSNLIRFRSKSTIQNAKRNTIIVTMITTISMSPALIVYYWNETIKVCQTYTDVVALIFVFSQVIITNVVAPLLMIILGCLTIYNIRQNTIRVRAERIIQNNRRTEGQLARMLLLQIILILITTVPYISIFSLNSLYPLTQTPFIIAIRSITILIVQTQFYISFFLYIISGQIYRQEFIKILKKINLLQMHTQTDSNRA